MKNQTRMFSLTRAIPLLCLSSGLAFAGTWPGILVDAKCFESARDNHNVSDSPVLQDLGFEVRLCSPKLKTHSFAIVNDDGEPMNLDTVGNAQAAELVRQGSKKSPRYVTVTGRRQTHTLAVNSITPVR